MNRLDNARRSLILTTTVNGLTPVLVVFSIYLTLRGHNAPGGGFAGGLVVAAAVALRYLASGGTGLRTLRVDPILLMGSGLGLSALVFTLPLATGDAFGESSILEVALPLLGEVKLVSSSVFDVGVYLLVVGVVMAIVVAFVDADDEIARSEAARGQR